MPVRPGCSAVPASSKDDPRVEAYGTVDELNSCLGVVRALGASAETDEVAATDSE